MLQISYSINRCFFAITSPIDATGTPLYTQPAGWNASPNLQIGWYQTMEMSSSTLFNRIARAAMRLDGRSVVPFDANSGSLQVNGSVSETDKQANGHKAAHRTYTNATPQPQPQTQIQAQTQAQTQTKTQATTMLEQELASQRQLTAGLLAQVADLQAQLRERTIQIQEMDTYAYTVAHGLKTPLSVITFASEMLLQSEASGVPDPDAAELLESINRMGYKMAHIIENLLTLTGLSQAEVLGEPLEMAQILDEVQERLASTLTESKATVVFASPPESWPQAQGSRPLVEEVWENFIGNAIKYGNTPPRIELGAQLIENNMVQFWVQDNGLGIPKIFQNQIFKPFNRLHVNLANGHGLGLAIADRIVRKLGGQVGVESSGILGEGSVFSFTLPAA